MFDKLEAVESRFEELETLLADPDVIGRRGEFQKLSKEHADIEGLVAAFRRYKVVQAEREANKALLEEKDADMRAMAREEEARLSAEEDELAERMKILLLPKDPNDDKNIMLEVRGAFETAQSPMPISGNIGPRGDGYDPGKLTGIFLVGYGMFRFTVEFFREPDAQFDGTFFANTIHMGQVLCIPMVLGGLWLIVTAKRRRHRVEPIAGSESVA